jgi:hypothetical protein
MSMILQAARQMELSPVSYAHLQPDMQEKTAVQTLLDAGETQDGLKLLARLLPKPYAVAWLCQCARDEPLDVEDKAGASLAEAWLRDPSEDRRRAAFEFSNAGGYKTLGTWLAAAAGWSGGSLAPASQETPVPPAEHLTACAVVAAVNMMASLVPDQFSVRRKAYISRAMALLNTQGSATSMKKER